MANRTDNATRGVTGDGTVSGAFNAEKGIMYPSGKMETQGTDIVPSDLHKKNAMPKADKQPVNSGTKMSKHTPDLLFGKDSV